MNQNGMSNRTAKIKTEMENTDADHIYYNVVISHNDDNNPYNEPTIASFTQTMTSPILDNPSEWYASVIRFAIPTSEIPIHVIPIIPYSTDSTIFPLTNNNPNKMMYSITLSYDSKDVQVFLGYAPNNNITQPPLLTSNRPLPQSTNKYYYLYSYQQLIDAVNTALAGAYQSADFSASPPRVAGAPAPYLTYDPVTKLVSLVAESSFDSNTTTIKIYFNTILYELFWNSMNAYNNGFNATKGKNFEIYVKSNGNNSIPGNQMTLPDIKNPPTYSATIKYMAGDLATSSNILYISIADSNTGNTPASSPLFWTPYTVAQPSPAPPNWSAVVTYSLNEVVINSAVDGKVYISIANSNLNKAPATETKFWQPYTLTSPLPNPLVYHEMKQEFSTLIFWNGFRKIRFTTNYLPINQEFTVNVDDKNQLSNTPILTDFEPVFDQGYDQRTYIQYYPPGEYRLINLQSQMPLNKFDVNVQWEDNTQQAHPIYIPPHDSVTIKILFVKKSFYSKK